MKKRVILLWMCLFAVCILQACTWKQQKESSEVVRGEAPVYEDGRITIGLIQTGKESDWRDANTQDYLDTFTEENGYNLIYIDGNSSPERQVKAMYDLIAQRVDYIVLQPIVETGWEEAVEKAGQAGIPVIVADREIAVDESRYVTWIGSDFYTEGVNAIKWLEEYQASEGEETLNIVLLEGTQGATATIGRTEGILDGIKEHAQWNIVARECADFTQGEGQTVMETLLGELDGNDIDVIISENDNMIFGAMKALDRKGISYGPNGSIVMISFDALGDAFQKMMQGKLHASVECNPLLAETVREVITELENGNEVAKKYYTRESVFTYENAAEYADERTY